jgi:integrase
MAKKTDDRNKYSEQTKRHRTRFPGVYQREAERVLGEQDIVFDISYKKDGKKVWEKIGWRSQGYSAELARRIRNERIITLQHGDELPQDKKAAIRFKTLAEKYLQWSSENKNRAGIEDKSRYERHLKKRFDEKRLDEIVPLDLERMKLEMSKAGKSPKTVAHCLGLLRAMFNKALDWNLYEGPNPVKKIKMPTVQNARDRFLSVEEANALLRELKRNPWNQKEYKELNDPQLHDIALISLHTGARAGELFTITGNDIDFSNGLIALRDTKNKETRYAPMTKDVKDILRRRIPEDRSGFVFTTKDGKQIKEVSNAFGRVVDRLKFNEGVNDPRQRIVFHSLRHSFASWLAIQGTPLYTIARLMGHKSISMSERYSHLSPDHKKDAVSGIEKAFNGGKGVEVQNIEKHRE